MAKVEAKLYEVNIGDEVHTIVESPAHLPDGLEGVAPADTFNLVMVDVSGSMSCYWGTILENWNKIIAPLLTGTTKIFLFGSDVYFRRSEAYLQQGDMLSESTNLTEAIAVINKEIHNAKQRFNRLFLVTDGMHNTTEVMPDTEIAKLSIPKEKTVEVFLLGIGDSFPVEYSISIRSLLHNGNSNVPSLFWAKLDETVSFTREFINESIIEQLSGIEDLLKKGFAKLQFSPPGHVGPGFPQISLTHLGEFVYFPPTSTEVKSTLNFLTEEGAPLVVEISEEVIDLQFLLDKVFRQWNSLLIQQHRNHEPVPMDTFDIMEKMYSSLMDKFHYEVDKGEPNSITARLHKKKIKYYRTEFDTLMNQSKTIIGIEGKYESELELAKNILRTTVKSKYDVKIMKMKGHGMDNYAEDLKVFVEIYEKNKEKIMALPEPSDDDCCRVTLGSFVKDLQDPAFLALLQEDKFTLMKTMSVTGVPIYAPVKDCSQINPWTLQIVSILRSPFTIISQTTLELSAEVDSSKMTADDKEVYLQEGDESTKFNAVIPVFVPQVAKVLKPLVRTNIFAMLSTFCILKNPHIIDHNAHIAALGSVWIKLITDYPKTSRPEFVTNQISQIEATGKLYLDRSGIARYLSALLNEPHTALMTECPSPESDDPPLKCESLVKPAFLLFLSRETPNLAFALNRILSLMVAEFVGRCLSANDVGVYGRTFVKDFKTKAMQEKWFHNKLHNTCGKIIQGFIEEKGQLLDSYFYMSSLRRDLKRFCSKWLDGAKDSMYEIEINMEMMENLRNVSSAGNLQLRSLKAFAEEMNISEQDINEVFGEKKMLIYAMHALQTKGSRERMEKDVLSYEYEKTLQELKRKVEAENGKKFKCLVIKQLLEETENIWTESFTAIHESAIVKPMTTAHIIESASSRGIQITELNFHQVYKYSAKSGLLRNACMVEECPFYLRPRNTFNEHISTERRRDFPHQLHMVSLEAAARGEMAEEVIQTLAAGKIFKLDGRKSNSPPSKARLDDLRNKIDELIAEYKKMNH